MSRAPAALFLLADCRGREALAEAAAVRSFKEDLARLIPEPRTRPSQGRRPSRAPGSLSDGHVFPHRSRWRWRWGYAESDGSPGLLDEHEVPNDGCTAPLAGANVSIYEAAWSYGQSSSSYNHPAC